MLWLGNNRQTNFVWYFKIIFLEHILVHSNCEIHGGTVTQPSLLGRWAYVRIVNVSKFYMRSELLKCDDRGYPFSNKNLEEEKNCQKKPINKLQLHKRSTMTSNTIKRINTHEPEEPRVKEQQPSLFVIFPSPSIALPCFIAVLVLMLLFKLLFTHFWIAHRHLQTRAMTKN